MYGLTTLDNVNTARVDIYQIEIIKNIDDITNIDKYYAYHIPKIFGVVLKKSILSELSFKDYDWKLENNQHITIINKKSIFIHTILTDGNWVKVNVATDCTFFLQKTKSWDWTVKWCRKRICADEVAHTIEE